MTDFQPAVKITVRHDKNRGMFSATIRTTSISETPGFRIERYSLFGAFVGGDVLFEEVARFNAKKFAAFTRNAILVARERGVAGKSA